MSIYDKASLVLIPSGTKTSKVYSQKPTNGDGDFTFSRSTAATRVNASGNIEKETQNILPYSNTFNTGWSPKAGTFTQGVADPNGGSTAWSWTALNTDPYIYSQTAWSGVFTLSIWAKGVGSSIGKDFEFRMGGVVQSFTLTSEWQRFELFVSGSASSIGFEVGNPAVAGDVVHIYGAQLEQGLVARDYIETTTTAIYGGITDNVPRLDYTDSSCPALLLEPQRTNLVTQSEYLADTTNWPRYGSSVTSNSVTSPEGVQNASTLVADGTTGQHQIIEVIALGAGKTLSVFAKAGTNNFIQFYTDYTNNDYANFDLAEGVVGSVGVDATADIEDYGNGWYRCIMTTGNAASQNFVINIVSSKTAARTESTSLSTNVYLYGAMIETGSYPTSYIPTYGSAVTRNGETCNSAGTSATFNDSEGVLFAEISALANDSTNRIISVSDGSGSNRLLIKYDNSSNLIEASLTDGGGDQAVLTHTYTIVNNVKIAFKYKANDFALWVNGTEVDTDSSGTMPSGLDTLNFDNGSGGSVFYGKTKELIYFPTELSDSELATLTTL